MEKVIPPTLYKPIQNYIQAVIHEFDQIPQERKALLQALSNYILSKTKAGKPAKLIFICTHNSRRSHISQIWAQTAAFYYSIENIETFSGGTEATAFNTRAVKAIATAGFHIEKAVDEENPVYEVKLSDAVAPIKAYSKVYDEPGNPKKNFAAVMTCSQADEACPFIPGAEARIAIPYDDPKAFDETPQEEATYDERTRQIARELFYAFSLVTNKIFKHQLIEVRPLTLQDWVSVKAIYEEGILTGDATFETQSPNMEQWNEAHLPHSRLVALQEDGSVCGWAALSPVSKRNVYKGVAEVSIYIAEKARGKGIGKLLLQQLIKESEQQDLWTLQASIFPENKASIHLHQQLGFRIVGYRERIAKLHDLWRNTVILERRSTVTGIS